MMLAEYNGNGHVEKCRWVVIMIHPWAVKKKKTSEIVNEIRRRLKNPFLQVCYSVYEDSTKKYRNAFEDYLFVEYQEGMSYLNIKDEEFFTGVLLTGGGQPEVLEDEALEPIRKQLFALPQFEEGDSVGVREGAYFGHRGRVIAMVPTDTEGEAQVLVRIFLGERDEEAAIPCRYLKKIKIKNV